MYFFSSIYSFNLLTLKGGIERSNVLRSSQLLAEVEGLMFNDWMLGKFKSNLERLDRFDSGERIA